MSICECILWARAKSKLAAEAGNFTDFTNYQNIEANWKSILETNIQNSVKYKK